MMVCEYHGEAMLFSVRGREGSSVFISSLLLRRRLSDGGILWLLSGETM